MGQENDGATDLVSVFDGFAINLKGQFSGSGSGQSGNDVKERGFSRTIVSHDADSIPTHNVGGNAAQRLDFVEMFCDVVEGDAQIQNRTFLGSLAGVKNCLLVFDGLEGFATMGTK